MYKQTIFNHDIMNCTHEAVTGNYLYCSRALGLTEPEDIIQLHPALKSEWQAITAHYERIGLSHSQTVIWDTSFSVLADFPSYDISVFYFGDTVSRNSPTREWFCRLDPHWFSVVESVNCKNQFTQLAEALGVKIPKTIRFNSKTDIQHYDQLPYPCYVKPAVSVSGVGIYRCSDHQSLKQALQEISEDVPLQIQQEVNASQFLNLQYRITEQGAERLAATEQILEGCAHLGNRYPTDHQPWTLVDPIAQWMASRGMKGIFAFDIAVVEAGDQTDYFAIECNPRFNGASYPTEIAQKLDLSAWTSECFKTHCHSLAEIDLSDLEYNPVRGTGVILVNWGSVLVGKLGVLIAGSPVQQHALRERLQQRLLQRTPQMV